MVDLISHMLMSVQFLFEEIRDYPALSILIFFRRSLRKGLMAQYLGGSWLCVCVLVACQNTPTLPNHAHL